MTFTPKYAVSYKGVFHVGGIPFEIDEADCKEMKRHGIVEQAVMPEKKKPPPARESTDRKNGRPKKAVSE